ncbi:MAG: hypothetical protein ABIU77_24690 [Ferruginibacter sp.]
MAVVKKTRTRSSVKKTENKTVIITKSTATDTTSFPKKVKAMNSLLAKATLLSS